MMNVRMLNMFSNAKRSMLILALIGNIAGVLLLVSEDFGAWQDRDPFYSVSEGYVWIGSEKAFPWAQIIIITLIAFHGLSGYIVFQSLFKPDSVSVGMVKRGYQSSLAVTVLSVVFGLIFVMLVLDSDWWWFGGGFYGSLIGGIVSSYAQRVNQIN